MTSRLLQLDSKSHHFVSVQAIKVSQCEFVMAIKNGQKRKVGAHERACQVASAVMIRRSPSFPSLPSQLLAKIIIIHITIMFLNVWYHLAIDVLPAQASAVPCKQRNLFSPTQQDPELLEALKVLKFSYKKNHLNFVNDLMTHEED